MHSDIIVVSGVPRSGTSLMMQMLVQGGIEALTDQNRAADEDNPRGYYEPEQVKKLKTDASWMAAARGKAVKVISQLLFDLPATESYRVLLMHRRLDEVLASQEIMLIRRGQTVSSREKLNAGFQIHLAQLETWLAKQPNLHLLRVDYAAVIAAPRDHATRINAFLDGWLDV